MTTGAMRSSTMAAAAVDAVDLRHLDVHDHQVGAQLPGQLERLLAVAGLTGDDVALLGEHLGEVEADQRLVLDDEHAACHGLSLGSGLRSRLGHRDPPDGCDGSLTRSRQAKRAVYPVPGYAIRCAGSDD